MIEFALHLTKCSREKPRPQILSVQIESFISFSSNQACLITFQLKGPSVNVTSSRCFPFRRSHAKLFSRKQNDGILKCASAEFQALEQYRRRSRFTCVSSGKLLLQRSRQRARTLPRQLCRTCPSEPVRRLLRTAQREMTRQNSTLQHCQYLTIFDPWNRLKTVKTGHLFMLFFPSP